MDYPWFFAPPPVCVFPLSNTRDPREGPRTYHPAIILVGDPSRGKIRELACLQEGVLSTKYGGLARAKRESQ